MPYLFRWKSPADLAELEETNDRLRRDPTAPRACGDEGYATRLQLVVKERCERIDQLTGLIDQLRSANLKLDEEAERLAEMVRLAP